MNNAAVLITTFNRKEKTRACLERLLRLEVSIPIYLLDDNSTDGTFEMIKYEFPNVRLVRGNGNLFWNRGMHRAWSEAAKKKHDFYIWLNDDVILHQDALAEIYKCSLAENHEAIISGLIECNKTGKIIYGGSNQNKKLIEPTGYSQPIRFMNGNVVLVPRKVFEKLGNLDPVFHHDLGDVDYGLRAQKFGFKVLTTTKVVGSGEPNPQCRVRLNNSTISKRFQKLYSPLGSNPHINFRFRKRHYGLFNASVYYVFQHFLNFIPDVLNKVLFGNRYLIK